MTDETPEVAPPQPAPRELPHSPETEAAVLSAWMLKDSFALAWKPEPDLFHIGKHRLIAQAMAAIDSHGRDETTVLAELDRQGTLNRIGGNAALFQVTNQAPSYADPMPHVTRLRELAALRSLVKSLEVATSEAYESKNLGELLGKIQEAARAGTLATAAKVFTVAQLVELIANRDQKQVQTKRCPSGVEQFDVETGGFRHGYVAVIGAATSWGKSSLAVMVCDETMKQTQRPLLVSWEDGEELYARRLVARREKIQASNLRDNELTDEERSKILALTKTAEREPFFLNAIGKSVERVASDIRSICIAEGIDLVIADYVQAIPCAKRTQDRRNEVTHVARTLSDVIKASGAAGILFSQIRRLTKGERPTMSDLKESGDLENAAEMVVLGYQSAAGVPRISVVKNKDGIKGVEYPLAWDPNTCSFLGQLDHEPAPLARAPKPTPTTPSNHFQDPEF